MNLIASDSTYYISILSYEIHLHPAQDWKERKNTIFMSCHKIVSETQQSIQLFHNFLKDYCDSHSRCRKQGYRALYRQNSHSQRSCPHYDAETESRTFKHAIKK